MLKSVARLTIVFLAGSLWAIAVSGLVALVDSASFALLTLFPFKEASSFVLAHRITTGAVSSIIAGGVFGLALAALARSQQILVLAVFVLAGVLSALVFWPLQTYDSSAVEVFGQTFSPALWIGLLVACAVAWSRRDQSSSSEGVSVAAP